MLLDEMRTFGLDGKTIALQEISENQWKLRCMQAAVDFAADLPGLVQTRITDLTATFPDYKYLLVPHTRIHELISTARSKSELADCAETSRFQRAAGMVEYCITGCDELWEAIRREYTDRGGWPLETSAVLAILLRMYGNATIAAELNTIYSPAVARALLLQRTSAIIEERLSRIVSDAASKFGSRKLRAPPIGVALVKKAEGEPRRILDAAIELRDRAKPLRKVLTPLAQKIAQGEPEGVFAFDKKAQELANLLEEDLGLTRAPRFSDALELNFVMGLPAVNLKIGELIDWANDRWKRRSVTVLTDISKVLAFHSTLERDYGKLIRYVAP
jgi:hypothetical protein